MLASLLDDAIRTLGATEALVVALVDRRFQRQANASLGVVGKVRAHVTSTAGRLLLETVCALTSNDRVVSQDDTLAGHIVVGVNEILPSKRTRDNKIQKLLQLLLCYRQYTGNTISS